MATKTGRKILEVRKRTCSCMGHGTDMTCASTLESQSWKYAVYISVPLVFGYGVGRLPGFWEKSAELVRRCMHGRACTIHDVVLESGSETEHLRLIARTCSYHPQLQTPRAPTCPWN